MSSAISPGAVSLRASVFDRLTEIRQSQTRQLQAQSRICKNSLVIYSRGSTATEAIEAFTAGFDQLNNATITPAQQQAIVDYYNNAVRTSRGRADRQRGRRRRVAADVERPEVSAGQLHDAVHRLGRGDQVRRRPRRQRLVGGQRPVQRLLPRDRDAVRVRGRAAARHPGQRRLQRVQGRRPRHQHPQRAVQGRRTAPTRTRRPSTPTRSTMSASPTSASTSPPTSRPPGWCPRSGRRAASKACSRCSSRSPRSTG